MRRRERGAVLVLVLGAVALLAALAVEVASRANRDVMAAARLRRNAAFRRLFDSGTEVATALLAEAGRRPYTYWGDSWNREFRFTLDPAEEAVVRVSDESGKINIARGWSPKGARPATPRTLSRLFDYLRRHDRPRAAEWKAIEAKVLKRLAEPEPLLSLDGLREAGLSIGQVFGEGGLARYLTTFGDGRVNLNTAPKAVLYALDEDFDDGIVSRIAGYRGKKEGEPGTYKPFLEPKDLLLVEGILVRTIVNGETRVVRDLSARVSSVITTQSSAFSARIEASVGGARREAWAFFQPDPAGGARKTALEEIQP